MRIAQQPTACDSFDAHRMSGKASAQRTRILEFITERGGDFSIGEIAKMLTMEKSTVSARLHELLNETGELVEKPRRKDKYSNVTIRPVGLPVVGQAELF